MNKYQIIKGAIITEKTTIMRSMNNVYAFSVDVNANKNDVKRAVESLFNVVVKDVKIQNYDGKRKRLGKYIGKSNKVKKAYVKVQEGQEISQFEGI